MQQSDQNLWLTPTAIIAAYAAVVATVTLVWNIFREAAANKKRLRIDTTTTQAWTQQGPLQSPVFASLEVKIRNHSKGSIYANRPTFVLSRAITTRVGETNRLENPIKGTFPLELKPGEQSKLDYQLGPLLETIGDQLKPKDKVWIEIKDTFDNVYVSRKHTYKALQDQVRFAEEYNRTNQKKA